MWSEAQHHEFIAWIAVNGEVGDVIAGAGADGARKVRWSVQGKGKRGGCRVIYFNLCADEIVLLVAVYAKADKTNMLPSEIERN